MARILQEVPGHRIEAPYMKTQPMNGIIAKLSKLGECANLHNSGHVRVIVSEIYDTQGHAICHLIELNNSTVAATSSSPHGWIGYDFGPSVRILPVSYSVKSRSGYDRWPNTPHSWLIETSVDGVSWTTIDWQINVEAVKENLAVNHFETKRVSLPCRYIRLAQIANAAGTEHFVLSGLEIFGACYEISK